VEGQTQETQGRKSGVLEGKKNTLKNSETKGGGYLAHAAKMTKKKQGRGGKTVYKKKKKCHKIIQGKGEKTQWGGGKKRHGGRIFPGRG